MENNDANTDYHKFVRLGDRKWEIVEITIGIFQFPPKIPITQGGGVGVQTMLFWIPFCGSNTKLVSQHKTTNQEKKNFKKKIEIFILSPLLYHLCLFNIKFAYTLSLQYTIILLTWFPRK